MLQWVTARVGENYFTWQVVNPEEDGGFVDFLMKMSRSIASRDGEEIEVDIEQPCDPEKARWTHNFVIDPPSRGEVCDSFPDCECHCVCVTPSPAPSETDDRPSSPVGMCATYTSDGTFIFNDPDNCDSRPSSASAAQQQENGVNGEVTGKDGVEVAALAAAALETVKEMTRLGYDPRVANPKRKDTFGVIRFPHQKPEEAERIQRERKWRGPPRPPPRKTKPKEPKVMSTAASAVMEQSNGANGEVTGKDGVNKAQKAKKAAKTAAKKAAAKTIRKAKKGNMPKKQKMKQGIVKDIVGTALQAKTTIKSYVTPNGKGGYNVCVTLGYLTTGSALTQSGFFVPGSVIFSTIIDRSAFAGTDLELYISGAEEMKISNVSHSLVTSLASTVSGSLYEFTDPDPGDPLAVNAVIKSATIGSHQSNEKRTMWPGWERAPATFTKKWVYTDPSISQFSSLSPAIGAQDTRLNAFGILNICLGDNVPSSVVNIGELFLHCHVSFRNSQRSDMQNLVATGRIVASNPTQTFQLASGTTFDAMGMIVTAVPAQWGAGACEYTYNPQLATQIGGTFTYRLPPGDYIGIARAGTYNSISPTSTNNGSTISNGKWSIREVAVVDANAANEVEFSTGTITSAATTVAIICDVVEFRISSATGSNGRASVQHLFTPSFTGGPAGYSWITYSLRRVAGFDSNPVAAPFPQGAANAGVGMSAEERGYVTLFDSASNDVDRDFAVSRLVQKIGQKELKRFPLLEAYFQTAMLPRVLGLFEQTVTSARTSKVEHEVKVEYPGWAFPNQIGPTYDPRFTNGEKPIYATKTKVVEPDTPDEPELIDLPEAHHPGIDHRLCKPRHSGGKSWKQHNGACPDEEPEEDPLSKSVHLPAAAASNLTTLLSRLTARAGVSSKDDEVKSNK